MPDKIKVCSIIGTRPEAIKMAPVVTELSRRPECAHTLVVTGQHRSMLDQMLKMFDLHPDHDLDIMLPRQTLTQITTRTLDRIEKIFESEKPDIVLVHGDTTTSFVCALGAYYSKIPVGHVEAGLRTYDKYNPYPEEMNRCLIDAISDFCFAPTAGSRETLLRENVPEEKIIVTGNTVIDALLLTTAMPEPAGLLADVPPDAKVLLVEAHRRENWGQPMRDICLGIKDVADARDDLHVVFPVHLNPIVKDVASEILSGHPRVHLLAPQDYLPFVFLMKKAHIIMTDSGGIQEEAPSLGKPVLVLRTVTERPEAVAAGTAAVIGPDRAKINEYVNRLLDDSVFYSAMTRASNPYGDGNAARRIADCVIGKFKNAL